MLRKAMISLIVLQSCSVHTSPPNHDASKVSSAAMVLTDSVKVSSTLELSHCTPNDSINKEYHVNYVIVNGHYAVRAGNSNWDTLFPNRYDCDAPHSIVPTYDWSTSTLLTLRRGCSNYCVVNHIVIPSERRVVERENIFAHDNSGLIAYCKEEIRDSIYIEDIHLGGSRGISLPKRLECATMLQCIESAEFRNGKLIVVVYSADDRQEYHSRYTFRL